MGHESRPQETTSKEAIGPRVGARTAWRAAVMALVMVAGISGSGRAQSPAEVFLENCARCHGETGKSDVPLSRTLKVAPLVDDARLARMTPEEIARVIREDPKHAAVVELRHVDLDSAAEYVKKLAATHD